VSTDRVRLSAEQLSEYRYYRSKFVVASDAILIARTGMGF
jgi:hypothetical protein